MSSLTDRTATPDGPPRQRRPRGVVIAVVLTAAVALAAIVVAVVAITRPGDGAGSGSTSDAATTAQIQQACQQWLSDTPVPAQPRPDAQWCGELTAWMTGQMASGPMRGPMMWQDPDAMLSTCVRAMSGTTGDPASWCRDMVTWMTEHMGRWTGSDNAWDQWHMGPR